MFYNSQSKKSDTVILFMECKDCSKDIFDVSFCVKYMCRLR